MKKALSVLGIVLLVSTSMFTNAHAGGLGYGSHAGYWYSWQGMWNSDTWNRGKVSNHYRFRFAADNGDNEDTVTTSQKITFLSKLITRLERMRTNIQDSQMTSDQKTRIVGKINDLISIARDTIVILSAEASPPPPGTGGTGTGGTGTGWTGTGDVTAPVITMLATTGTTSNASTLTFDSNESGTGYYVVVTSGSTAPTASQIMLGQNASSQTANAWGNGTMSSGSNQLSITGLATSTMYTVYFVATDSSGNQTDVMDLNFMTLSSGGGGGGGGGGSSDTTPPTISALSVTASGSTATLHATSNEAGVGYFVILSSGAMAPTANQLRLGQDGSGQTAPVWGSGSVVSGDNHFNFTGINATDAYTAYFTARDNAGNDSAVSSVNFTLSGATGTGTTGTGTTGTGTTGTGTTGTGTTGTGTTGTGTTGTGTTGTGTTVSSVSFFNGTVNLNFVSSITGTGYFVVVPSGSVVPTATQIRSGQDGAGQSVSIQGSWAVTVGSNQFPITGLASSSDYIVYLVTSDANGNLTEVHAVSLFTFGP